MSMDHFYDSRFNMPVEMKKAFEDQLTAIKQQQEKIKSLIEITERQVETTEKQATVVKDLLNEIEIQGKRSSFQGWLSLIFSTVAVLIAALAIWFSLQDFRSDEVWQQEQIRVLEEIRQSIRP